MMNRSRILSPSEGDLAPNDTFNETTETARSSPIISTYRAIPHSIVSKTVRRGVEVSSSIIQRSLPEQILNEVSFSHGDSPVWTSTLVKQRYSLDDLPHPSRLRKRRKTGLVDRNTNIRESPRTLAGQEHLSQLKRKCTNLYQNDEDIDGCAWRSKRFQRFSINSQCLSDCEGILNGTLRSVHSEGPTSVQTTPQTSGGSKWEKYMSGSIHDSELKQKFQLLAEEATTSEDSLLKQKFPLLAEEVPELEPDFWKMPYPRPRLPYSHTDPPVTGFTLPSRDEAGLSRSSNVNLEDSDWTGPYSTHLTADADKQESLLPGSVDFQPPPLIHKFDTAICHLGKETEGLNKSQDENHTSPRSSQVPQAHPAEEGNGSQNSQGLFPDLEE